MMDEKARFRKKRYRSHHMKDEAGNHKMSLEQAQIKNVRHTPSKDSRRN